jgi:HEPN superfamily AbiU2-like protein
MDQDRVIADPTNRDELIEWLKVIHDHVYDLRSKQFIFGHVWRLIRENPELQKRQSHLYLWIYNLYVEGMAMAIRRLCDDDDRTVSLVRFLGFVKKDPSVISRASYGSLFPADTIGHPALPGEVKAALRDHLINRGYDQTVGEGVSQPRGKDLRKEISELTRLADEIVDYATKRVAHFDKEPPKQYPGLESIDRVIEQSSAIVQKYYLLLKAVDMDMNVYFHYDWFAPLRVTWLPDKAWFAGGFEKGGAPPEDSTDHTPHT